MKYALRALDELDDVLAGAGRVLIASDFDGTLCPIAPSPDQVRPAPGMTEILRRLTELRRVTLAVLSGRELSDLRCRVPAGIVLAGNHGLEIAGSGLDFVHPEAMLCRAPLTAACERLREVAQRWEGVWVEDKNLSATVHFRLADPRHHRTILYESRRSLAQFGKRFALRAGAKALEVRPHVKWEKGSAIDWIDSRLGPFDMIVSLGDDRTDETMFVVGPRRLNVKIGCSRPTRAGYWLADVGETAILLAHVADQLRVSQAAAAGSTQRMAGAPMQ